MRHVRDTVGVALGIIVAMTGTGLERIAAQEPAAPGPPCLLTLDEMSQLVGATFVTMDAGDRECAYAGDPAVDLLSVLLRVEPTEGSPDAPEDGLWLVRLDYDRGGRDVTVAGLPAWVSDDGAWVDVGSDVLAVRPTFQFDDDAPAVVDVVPAVAELAVSRLLAQPPASPGPGLSAATGQAGERRATRAEPAG